MNSTIQNGNQVDRRKDLIRATIETIYEDGISNVTLNKVASRSDLSPGIVNFYFKSKNNLLLETLTSVIDEYLQVLKQWLKHADTASQKIDGYIHSCFDKRIFVKHKIAAWYAFRSEFHANKNYRSVLTRVEKYESDLVLNCISELLKQKGQSVENAKVLSKGLQGLTDSIWQQTLMSSTAIDPLSALDQCEHYLACVGLGSDLDRSPSPTTGELSDLLPFWTYQDQEFFDLEIEHLFKPSWMLVGHVSEVPKAGDYLTFEGFGERALVVRNKDGKINAFHNICRHRGSTLLVGQGRCRQSLTCPFHGWRYDFDGALQFIPGKEGFPHVNPKQISLKPIELEIWQGFIFIRFVAGGASLASELQPIESEISEYRLEELQPYQEPAHYAMDNLEALQINWKIYHDIDNEGYHVPIGHPTLQQLYGQSYKDTFVNGIPISKGHFNKAKGRLWSVDRYRKLMPRFEHLSKQRHNLWLYVGVFPNLVLAFYPEMMEIYMTIPVDLTRTNVIAKCYALPDERRGIEALRYLNRRINVTTASEDYFYMESMQAGLNSSAYPQWTLSDTAETGIRAYHHAIQARLPVAILASRPPQGMLAKVNDELKANEPARVRR